MSKHCFDIKFVTLGQLSSHYANTPMQYTAIFHGDKNLICSKKNIIFFLFLLKT